MGERLYLRGRRRPRSAADDGLKQQDRIALGQRPLTRVAGDELTVDCGADGFGRVAQRGHQSASVLPAPNWCGRPSSWMVIVPVFLGAPSEVETSRFFMRWRLPVLRWQLSNS